MKIQELVAGYHVRVNRKIIGEVCIDCANEIKTTIFAYSSSSDVLLPRPESNFCSGDICTKCKNRILK